MKLNLEAFESEIDENYPIPEFIYAGIFQFQPFIDEWYYDRVFAQFNEE